MMTLCSCRSAKYLFKESPCLLLVTGAENWAASGQYSLDLEYIGYYQIIYRNTYLHKIHISVLVIY